MSKVKWAIDNNIELCHSVALAHELSPVRLPDVWRCGAPMPPFYPNLITRSAHQLAQTEIRELKDLLPGGWGVKDSFANLDLGDERFQCVISGAWFCTSLTQWVSPVATSPLKCVPVTSEETFKQWLLAWNSDVAYRVFPKGIWQQHNLLFLFIKAGQDVVGGCLLNTPAQDATRIYDSPVVGLSNWFGDLAAIRWALDQQVSADTTLVGYTDLDEIDALELLGFERLSNLRVWVHTP